MMYPISLQNINLKYFVFWATKNGSEYSDKFPFSNLQKLSDFFNFRVAHNTKYLKLIFATFAGWIWLQPDFLKLIDIIFDFF
jgi:hypothetical protein